MKKIWKWILLFVGVGVLGFLCAMPFFAFRRFGLMREFAGPMMFRHFRFMPHGMMGGGIIWTVLSCLLGLAVIAGVVILIVLLVRRKKQPIAVASPVPPTPADAETAEVAQPVEAKACALCGQSLKANWVACPHCGARVEAMPDPVDPNLPKPE
jgi:hypothetical protein